MEREKMKIERRRGGEEMRLDSTKPSKKAHTVFTWRPGIRPVAIPASTPRKMNKSSSNILQAHQLRIRGFYNINIVPIHGAKIGLLQG